MRNDAMLTIAISTINERIFGITPLAILADVCEILVVHQVTDSNDYYYNELQSQGIQVIRSTDAGLSSSRNCAILNCKTQYCWFMDDDVEFDIGTVKKFIAAVKQSGCPIVVCGHLNASGQPAASYPSSSGVLRRRQLAKFTSIDICVNVLYLRDKKVLFDERFGLGTDLPANEEFIFLIDCFDQGLSVFFSKQCPVTHPGIDSGQIFYLETKHIDAKRESIKRVFKRVYFLILCLFIIKKIIPLVRARKLIFFSKRFLFAK